MEEMVASLESFFKLIPSVVGTTAWEMIIIKRHKSKNFSVVKISDDSINNIVSIQQPAVISSFSFYE